jgi:hypothetical protein
MKHEEGTNLYLTDDGTMFVRKSDGKVMGDGVDLGEGDSIDNYEEREFTAEERAAFWESIGIMDPKTRSERMDRPARYAGDNGTEDQEKA